jgi:hypothetical protein
MITYSILVVYIKAGSGLKNQGLPQGGVRPQTFTFFLFFPINMARLTYLST